MRQWPVERISEADIHIFARRCLSEGLQDCGVLMVSHHQSPLDEAALFKWADGIGINLRLWVGWSAFVREVQGSLDTQIATVSADIRERFSNR